ncbi:MAG: RNA polymerase sigma factor [Pseudonocardia sp.]
MSSLVDHDVGGDAPSGVDGDAPSDVDLASRPEDAPDPSADAAGSHVEQDAPAPSPMQQRIDFGAHLEANYQRLVAQLYAITLDPIEAHDVIQDAYSRAWRNWTMIGRSTDPTAWVRRVAVRTTIRSWRRKFARIGLGRPTPPVARGLDPRATALLTALHRLPFAERRSVVLFHMAGLSQGEIAGLERVPPSTIHTRLSQARRVVVEDMSDVVSGVLELPGADVHEDGGYR